MRNLRKGEIAPRQYPCRFVARTAPAYRVYTDPSGADGGGGGPWGVPGGKADGAVQLSAGIKGWPTAIGPYTGPAVDNGERGRPPGAARSPPAILTGINI